MSRMSANHIAVLLAIGAIVPMQLLESRPGFAETLGNGAANGFAAIAISDSAAGFATTAAIGGIAIGPDAHAFTQDATHPCMGTPTTNCGQGNIAIGTSSEASNDFAAAVGFLAHAGGLNGSAYGANTVARGQNSSAFGSGANAVGDGDAAYGANSKASGFDSSAFGGLANAVGSSSVAVGTSATANGDVSVAIGFVPTAENAAFALGDHARAGAANAIAIGNELFSYLVPARRTDMCGSAHIGDCLKKQIDWRLQKSLAQLQPLLRRTVNWCVA